MDEANGKKKQIRLTEGNITNGNLSVTPLRGFLPADCLGQAQKKAGRGNPIRLHLAGLGTTVGSDIGR